MWIDNQNLGKYNTLSMAIKRASYTVGFLFVMSGSVANAVTPIERSSTQAFAIPDEIIHRIAIGPVITSVDGMKYLQFIARTQQDNLYQNIIAGPLDRLLDKTIAWDNAVFSNQSFVLISPPFPLGTLVDLNNDGVNTLISGVSEYEINNRQTLISGDVFNGAVNRDGYGSPEFVDVDDDGDLDMLLSDWKYGDTDFYENTGTAESHVFVRREGNVSDILAQYSLSLPPEFLEYFNSLFFYPFPGRYDYPIILDFDSDGDQDLLMMSRSVPCTLKYFELIEKDGASIFSEPFSQFPASDHRASWVTDFDTDGDLDLLVKPAQGEVKFFQRTNNYPDQYASPVTITNFPQWSGPDYFGAPSSASISRSKEVFKDIDHDGFQEMLVVQSSDYGVFQLFLLRKQEDNSFERQLIYQGDEISYRASYALQFIDGNNDGKLDIALQFYYRDSGEMGAILLFVQQDPMTFSSPVTLASDALDLNQSWDDHLAVDFDLDGDIDQVYNHTVIWNLELNPGSITNFSTRSYVGEGSNILIGGFIIEGETPQTVILRGIGPSLTGDGVQAPLEDPELYLFSSNRLIAHNDDWQTAEGADKIETAGIGPAHSNEAALRVRLYPGEYTVHLKGKSGDTGVGIVAVDTDNQMPTGSLQVNISGRALVDEGENITIGGFIIEGDTPIKVLIRGLGPHLLEKGVANPLEDPKITLFSGDNIIASNNDWKRSANASEIAALNNAPSHDREAAILTELEPGTYTVHLRGGVDDTGVGIIAVDRL
ncbi:MAG: VCBS repeat-containing protein [Candidatus Thiodiazotropha sp. DIVDIV]